MSSKAVSMSLTRKRGMSRSLPRPPSRYGSSYLSEKEDGMPEGTEIFEVLHSTRAMRRLKPDPVPDDLIRQILLAGQAAASGGNTQRWRFLVLKDPEIKKKVQVYYRKAFDETVGPRYDTSPAPPGQSSGS